MPHSNEGKSLATSLKFLSDIFSANMMATSGVPIFPPIWPALVQLHSMLWLDRLLITNSPTKSSHLFQQKASPNNWSHSSQLNCMLVHTWVTLNRTKFLHFSQKWDWRKYYVVGHLYRHRPLTGQDSNKLWEKCVVRVAHHSPSLGTGGTMENAGNDRKGQNARYIYDFI